MHDLSSRPLLVICVSWSRRPVAILSLIFNLALSGRARFAQLVRRVCTTGRGHRLILFGFLSQNIEDESGGRGG